MELDFNGLFPDGRLDHRYIVLKKSDVAHLSQRRQKELVRVCAAVDFVRDVRNVGPLAAVVVERDWPEYEPTVTSIMRRVEGQMPVWFVVFSWAFAAAGLACLGYSLS